ncbi:DNA-binding protein HU-beta [Solimonas aquatica]|uniref:DNA-binding protein HU-beta n=1 Tax=Solimonas aquatica TaxID=489703 RepID=A0A1H9EZE2_9GAMM|nr:HU family DNA-binding protein [Solimonas aquatica]SEQ30989.1 DNA-binding protein HU-beta [Solimonas aquatica]
MAASYGRKHLIDDLTKELDLSKAQAARTVSAVFETLAKKIKKHGKVQVLPFGTFNVAKRAARKGVNPKTGTAIKIKASKSVRFKPSKSLKDSL